MHSPRRFDFRSHRRDAISGLVKRNTAMRLQDSVWPFQGSCKKTIAKGSSSLAANYLQLIQKLHDFYDFSDKTVLGVGTGTGQLFNPAMGMKKLVAIDRDAAALAQLKIKVAGAGMQDAVWMVCADFEDVALSGDVVYFEFCLHEMANPEKALRHAKVLAPEVVVYDHAAGSDWVYYGAEDEKVLASTEAMRRFGVRRWETFQAQQSFRNCEELLAKLSPQGTLAIERAQRFAGARNITIPMKCQLALL
jgi:ubiquinone/menaquinone biosynthesis C-methylase UbiE